MNDGMYPGEVEIAHEPAVLIVMPGREGQDLPLDDGDEVLRLARKGDLAVRHVPVVERADADGIARGDIGTGLCVIDNTGKLRIQAGEHIRAVQLIEGQQDLAVGIGDEGIAHLLQLAPDLAEAVQLAVAHDKVAAAVERLHTRRVQAHDREAVKADIALLRLRKIAHIRPARNGAVKRQFRLRRRDALSRQNIDRTHKIPPWTKKRPYVPENLGRIAVYPRCHLIYRPKAVPLALQALSHDKSFRTDAAVTASLLGFPRSGRGSEVFFPRTLCGALTCPRSL